MTRIYLNELKAAERQIPHPEPGRWKSDPAFLEKFAHDIYVKGQLGDGIVNSVPSVFARPIQFYQAFGATTHPMHNAVVAQWRGLLAVFALHRALTIPLRVSRFELREKTQPDDLDRRFVEILRSQLPHPADEWKSWLLIYCNDQLVGATSPWTMIYTPTDYRVASGVPWVDTNGMLTDPLSKLYDDSENATNDELRVLLAWIDLLLLGHPWNMPRHHEDKTRAIAMELRQWRKELAQLVKPYEGVNRLEFPFSQATPPHSEFLSTLPVPPIEQTAASDLLLADDDTCETVVLSRTALRNPKLQKQRVRGGVRVEHLDLSRRALPAPSGQAGWTTKTGATVDRPYIIAEEYFLSDRLIALPLTGAARGVGSTEYALPLQPAFFQHFAVERLAQQIVSVEPSADGVTVRLRLPLKNGGTLQVERQYRQTDIERIPDGHHIPALAIWPDFYDSEWGDFEALLVDAGPPSPRLRFAPLFTRGNTGLPVALSEEHGDVAIWRSKAPVLGFGVEVAEPGHPPTSAGVIVRRSITPVQPTDATWEVGVDFGTSNTQIKLRTGDGESALTLRGRALLLTRATPGSTDRLSELHHRGEVVPPFPTLLRKESVLVLSEGTSTQLTVGVIPLNFDVTLLARGSGEYVRDLKWTADDDTQKLYLQSLVRLTSAEARASGVSRLKLRWSYPLSLPERIRSTMESFWASIGEARSRSGFIVDGIVSASESDAVSRYVTARDILPIAADSLSIGLDIGGGSTDVAFWTGQTLIDRVSLNIAANDVIRLAASFPEINQELVRHTAGASHGSGDQFNSAFLSWPEIMWNVLLAPANRQTSPHAQPFVVEMNMATNEQWQKCRTGAFLVMSGVFFYLGVHAGLHISAATGNVAVYVGGRGSAMLSWLAPSARLVDILTQYFLHGLKVARPDARPEIEIRGPVVGSAPKALLKDEVASGLIDRKELTATTRKGLDIAVTPAGEVNWIDSNGVEIPWHASVSAGQLATMKPPANHNSSFIAYYLTKVARPAGEPLNLDSAGLNALQLSQNWAINDMRKLHFDEYVLQPIFAYELKSLVRKYAENAAPTHP
ncbi:MAG: hypothetical protein ACXW5U_08125 [Thermoanaerobaculia bacterium]